MTSSNNHEKIGNKENEKKESENNMAIAISNTSKRISITSKRQMTIPQAFFSALGFTNEAECSIQDNALIIRPVKSEMTGEFAELILEDLIKQGYSGEELLNEFKKVQSSIKPAVNALLEEAHNAALGKTKAYTSDEVFS